MLKKILFALALAGSVLVSTSANGVTFSEDFSSSPFGNGWKIFGESNLFQWNSSNKNLRVTWDSSKPNSYFHRSLGTILGKDDNFSLSFDLRLNDIAIGVDTNKPFAFQIAIGFLNFAQATNTSFIRGSGYEAPNLVEFNYFPDSGFGNSISTPIISTNNGYASGGFTVGLELTPNDLFHVEMNYFASNQTLKTTITKNGAEFGPIEDTFLAASFSDFRLDTVAIESYSDAGQDPNYGGSILAHGEIDNLFVTVPESPIENLAAEFSCEVQGVRFNSKSNWIYALERSVDFLSWNAASPFTNGTGNPLFLQDTNTLGEKSFYRVRAERP